MEIINLEGKSNGHKIKILRAVSNVTQAELGEELGYESGMFLSHVESGKKNITDDRYLVIIKAINNICSRKQS